MNPFKRKSWIVGVFAALAISLPFTGDSQSLDQVMQAQQQRTRLSQESQERIDQVVKQTRGLEDQYKAVLKEIEGLEVYNTLLQRQVENQETQMTELTESIDQVEVINRQIVPIMTRMIESLDQFIALDIPFLPEERQNRVDSLKDLMERQDVSVAEKFRKVTEAYQIEMEFGSTVEAYKGTLEVNEVAREGNYIRIGRIVLIWQTEDGSESFAWDQPNRQWMQLGNEYRNQIRLALQIANKQVAPDLVLLPVDAPEAG